MCAELDRFSALSIHRSEAKGYDAWARAENSHLSHTTSPSSTHKWKRCLQWCTAESWFEPVEKRRNKYSGTSRLWICESSSEDHQMLIVVHRELELIYVWATYLHKICSHRESYICHWLARLLTVAVGTGAARKTRNYAWTTDEHFPIYQRLSPALVCGNQLKMTSNWKGRVLLDRRHLKGHRTAPLLHNIVDLSSQACMAYNIGIIHRQTDSVPLSATGEEHSTARLP